MGAGQPADAGPAVEQVNPNAHEAGQSEGTPSAYASSEPQAAQGSPSGCEDKGAPAEERAPESDHDKPTLTIGKLCSRLSSPHSGLLVTSDFLKALGFEGTKVKSATLFSESQWRGIKAALLTHIQECR